MRKIELWIRDPAQPPVYWLNGLAGTGKSTIAQTIAEKMSADKQLGASFFCSRDFSERSNLRLIFPTLAVQLARKYAKFRSILVPLLRSDPGIAEESLYRQMKELIVQPLMESAISTIIVIDALDECKDNEPASAILSVLREFVSQIPKVKFFLTGRPERRIHEGFHLLAEAKDVLVLHAVEPSQVDSDIRLFFTHSFKKIVDEGGWPTSEQLNLLCERAAGLFVYAVATVKFVTHRTSDPKEQLARLLQSSKDGVYEGKTKFNENSSLDSLYTSILQEAFDDDPDNNPMIRSILGGVILAANPLSPSTIAALLGFSINGVSPKLSAIQSLLILHEDNHPVRPFHKSFPDFIIDPTRCTTKRFHISPPVHHSELLIGCLQLMNQELKNICKLPDGVMNKEVNNQQKRAEQYIDSGLQYACMSWHKHLVDLITIPANITPILHQFLEKKFLFWLEVLSILGTVRDAVDALEVTARLLEVSQVYMVDIFPKFTYIGSRHHQLLTLLMTTFDLSLDFLRPSVHLLPISTTQPSPFLQKHHLCGNCTKNMLIPWQGWCGGYQWHGIQPLQLLNVPTQFGMLRGHSAVDLLQLLSLIPAWEYKF